MYFVRMNWCVGELDCIWEVSWLHICNSLCTLVQQANHISNGKMVLNPFQELLGWSLRVDWLNQWNSFKADSKLKIFWRVGNNWRFNQRYFSLSKNVVFEWVSKQVYNHKGKVAQYAGPVLILHTKRDSIVQVSHAERLAEWGGKDRVKLVVFPDGDHNYIWLVNHVQYVQELKDFFLLCGHHTTTTSKPNCRLQWIQFCFNSMSCCSTSLWKR